MQGNERLSRKQELALIALLSEPSLEAAAKAAGISAPTLWRWLQTAAFDTAYKQARRESMAQAISRLQAISGTAVETLLSVMQSEIAPASSRVAAATKILEMALKSTELDDLAERLGALEQQLLEMKGEQS